MASRLNEWLGYLMERYKEFISESKKSRYKIVGSELHPETNQLVLSVMVYGVKTQIMKYLPNEIITNDSILCEFSPSDVRAITYYALKDNFINPRQATYSITGQDFSQGKTIFTLKKQNEEGEIRKFASELYGDPKLLEHFSHTDLINVISTAIQEQTIDDLEQVAN